MFGRGLAYVDSSHMVGEQSGIIVSLMRRSRMHEIEMNLATPGKAPASGCDRPAVKL